MGIRGGGQTCRGRQGTPGGCGRSAERLWRHERYFLEIPVVRVEGRDVLAGRIEEEALRRLLSGEG
ncbi:MAG: hypothetical protein IRZ26_09095 [Clostridia bacterium]|nr:hypothetical protein [Clostridia bacterium]